MISIEVLRSSLPGYIHYLADSELAAATKRKYYRDIVRFLEMQGDRSTISKRDMVAFKRRLMERHRTATVNSYLISMNKYLSWLGRNDLATKTLRVQRRCSQENVITREEYSALLAACKKKETNEITFCCVPSPVRAFV